MTIIKSIKDFRWPGFRFTKNPAWHAGYYEAMKQHHQVVGVDTSWFLYLQKYHYAHWNEDCMSGKCKACKGIKVRIDEI